MYREFYGLKADPFCLDPDLGFLFMSNAHEEAVSHIVYGLQQDETIILITGDIGTGKTLAVHRVVGQLSATFVPVVIGVTTLDFLQFLRLVLFKLGEETPPADLSGALARLERILVDLRRANRKLLLIIDEAQNCECALLESIRLLLNLAQPGGQVLQLVIVGQIGLEEKLALPELRQLQQRIRVSYRLTCLDRQELEAYIGHRLEVAGRTKPLFGRGALDRIYALSGGVPRLVNQYASRALLAGFVENARTIEAKHVDEDVVATAARPAPAAARSARAAKPLAEIPPAAPEPAPTATRPAIPAPRPQEASDFAQRRPRRNGGRAVLVVVALLAVAAAAVATQRTWLPALRGVTGGSRPEAVEPAPAATPAASLPEQPARTPSVTSGDDADAAVASLAAAGRDSAAVSGQTSPATEPGPTLSAADTPATRAPADAAVAKPADRPTERPAAATPTTPPLAKATAPAAEPPSDRMAAPAAAAEPVTAGHDDNRPTSIHVFSFLVPDRAESSLAKLHADGLPAFITREMAANDRLWYRVYIGPLASRQRAETLVDSLGAAGVIRYHAYSHRLPGDS